MEVPAGLGLLIMLGLLMLLMFSGLWIAFGMIAVSLITLLLFRPDAVNYFGAYFFTNLNSYVLAAIPMFIFMGHIVLESGVSAKLYDGTTKITRILPGNLIHSNILSCSIFAAVSGSALATAVTIGTVAFPEQIKRGYDRKLVTGSILCAGTLGILIPPSVIMIIYGAFTRTSVAKLFAGGVIPGIILAVLFMAWVVVLTLMRPSYAPERSKLTWGYFPAALAAVKELVPVIILIGFIMGSIYSGVATPTESAAVSVVIAVVIAAFNRTLTFGMLLRAAMRAVSISTMMAILIFGGRMLGLAITMTGFGKQMIETLAASGLSPMLIWAILVVIYLIMGMLIEDLSMMLITLPVVFPLMTSLGFDPVWFGVMMTILVQLAIITPPVGIGLFAIQGISQGTPFTDIIKGAIPFVVIIIIGIALYSAFPQLVLWLPSLLFN